MHPVSAIGFVFVVLVCGGVLRFSPTQVHAESPGPAKNRLSTDGRVHETTPFQYRSDRYRDPFVPKPGFQNLADPALQAQDTGSPAVKVVGLLSSAGNRWAMLEFEDGNRLMVKAGQVLPAYSRVVSRITDRGVTLSAVKGKTQERSREERTYWLYDEDGSL